MAAHVRPVGVGPVLLRGLGLVGLPLRLIQNEGLFGDQCQIQARHLAWLGIFAGILRRCGLLQARNIDLT